MITIVSSSGIGGSAGAVDNAILRANGTGGAQTSAVTIDDTGNITMPIAAFLKFATNYMRMVDGIGLRIYDASPDAALDINIQSLVAGATVTAVDGVLRFLAITSSAAAATTTEYPADKNCGLHKNTVSGVVSLAYNDGGVIKTAALV